VNTEIVDSGLVVVGIGASAGGLEALQEFFKAMPSTTGIAFVVIQHLSPDYRSLMDELLARQTTIPIQIAMDGMAVEADHIYLIPPGKNISIYHEKLFLEEQSHRKVPNLPIDIFLRSLAADKGKNAIGIILSGTGSDGTLGTRAIKEAGGMIMAQDEHSAKFDGMPKSSISTGLVDYILTPAKMPEALINFIKHPFVKKSESLDRILAENIATLTKIIIILRDFSGIDFSYYKENTLIRRLERRLSINRFDSMEQYLIFLSESDKEKDILYRELLIGVTRFFRDQKAFESIAKHVLPDLLSKTSYRVWSAACSTGEEVYSLAMMIYEFLDKNKLNCEVKIFATDIDRHSIELAGQGFYPDSIVADVDSTFLTKYFHRKENGYQVNELIRKMIIFATHNLLKDPPFSKIDLLVCRNLFIYLKPDVQTRLLSMFYYSINPDGFVFLGGSETIGEMSQAFDCLDTKWKIYRYKAGFTPPIIKDIPIPRMVTPDLERGLHLMPRTVDGMRFERLMNIVMGTFLPPSVIVDANDNILHVINDTTPFIKPQPGRFSQNLLSNLPHELSLFVSALLRKMKRNDKEMVIESIVGLKGFEKHKISIEGRQLTTERSTFYMISFYLDDAGRSKTQTAPEPVELDENFLNKVSDLEKELQFTKESLQATIEELETSNEELQSSNEELIASNEELQNTNEELQSVNEELYTVNSEYQLKIDELTRLNNDVNNLLKNTEVGALYLDRNLAIRKITPLVSKITNIRQSDLGRPIAHLTILPHDESLIEDILKVGETLQPIDREIAYPNGLTYFARIRPYRTEFNAVEGILLTFVDVTNLKKETFRADLAGLRLKEALKIGEMAWWEWDVKTGKVLFDERKATMLGYRIEEFPTDVYEICNLIHSNDYESTMRNMRDYLEGLSKEWSMAYRIRRKDGRYSWYYDRGSIIERDEEGKPLKLIGTVIEISKLKKLEEELRQSRELLSTMLDNSPIAQTMVDAEGWITYANRQAEEIFEISRQEILTRTYNSDKWRILDLQGNAIPPDKLPFSIIKATGQSVRGFEHTIEMQGKKPLRLLIDGCPIKNETGEFKGAIFTIGVREHESRT